MFNEAMRTSVSSTLLRFLEHPPGGEEPGKLGHAPVPCMPHEILGAEAPRPLLGALDSEAKSGRVATQRADTAARD